MLGPDEELIAGRRPVEEAFVARRGAIRLLVVPQRREALEKLVLHATNLRIPIVEVEGGTLTALAGFDGHQGIGLVVTPRRYATVDEILARALERSEPVFVLALDSLEDPQNVGTLLRTAEAAGVHGVVFPTQRQAPLTPAAVKASAGAVEHLLMAPVEDLAATLADLHVRGLRIIGSDAEAPLAIRDADLRGPLAVVVGSEGQGLGTAVRRRSDLLVRIPMRGAIGSLNASVAGSILLYEALAQRTSGEPGSPPTPRSPKPASSRAKVASKALREATGESATKPSVKAVDKTAAKTSNEAPSKASSKAAKKAPARSPGKTGARKESTRRLATERPAEVAETQADAPPVEAELLPGGPPKDGELA